MTVSTTPSRVSYSGNGATTAFSFPYPFVAGDLVVVLTDEDDGSEVTQTISTHYTVSGTGLSNGIYASGTVTFVTAPGSDKQVIIYRAPPLTQETDLTAETSDELAINKRFDIIEMKLQRLDNARSRSLRASEGFYSTFDWTLPDVDGVNATAGQAIVLKNGVAGLQWGSPSSATVSAAMTPVVGAASLDDARSALGAAPADAQFIVSASDGELSNERVVTDTGTIAWDTGTSGQLKANIATGGVTYLALASAALATAAELQAGTASKLVNAAVAVSAGDVETISYAASIALDFTTFVNCKITLTGALTLSNPTTTGMKGRSGFIELWQDGSGGRLITWGSNYRFAGGTDIVLSTAANAIDLIAYVILSDGTVFVSAILDVKN